MNYSNIVERLPTLIKQLRNITTEYSSEQLYIGETITMLILLQDILSNQIDTTETDNDQTL